MGWFDLFRSKSSTVATANNAEDILRAARSLDIDVAIAAHENWKSRLLAYLEGKSTEDLRAEIVALDNRCDLGKWIYGDGETYLKTAVAFVDLKATHKMFHYSASTIVTLAQAGRTAEAQDMLASSFTKLSERIKSTLLELKKHR